MKMCLTGFALYIYINVDCFLSWKVHFLYSIFSCDLSVERFVANYEVIMEIT